MKIGYAGSEILLFQVDIGPVLKEKYFGGFHLILIQQLISHMVDGEFIIQMMTQICKPGERQVFLRTKALHRVPPSVRKSLQEE